jgi:hypothetical protein
MTALIPQREALLLQLAAIRGNEPATSLFEIRHKAHGRMRQQFVTVDRPRDAAETIAAVADLGDTYVGAAPRTKRSGGADAVDHVWCLWADVDSRAAANRLAVFAPAPTIVVLTGSGQNRHAWWALREPVEPGEAKILLRRVARALDADMKAAEPARILRPAGTVSHKHDPPAPVRCARVTLDVYRALDVAGGLADPPKDKPPAPPPVRTPLRDGDPLRGIPAAEYVPALTSRAVGRDGKIACPFHADDTPSLHVYPDDRGWYCFGCEIGGSIIDLGAHRYGIEPRGRGYHDIRRRLIADLLGRAAA